MTDQKDLGIAGQRTERGEHGAGRAIRSEVGDDLDRHVRVDAREHELGSLHGADERRAPHLRGTTVVPA